MKKLLYKLPFRAAYILFLGILCPFLPLIGVQAYGVGPAQAKSMFDVTIEASYKNTPLAEVFSDIEAKTDFEFTYDKNDAFLKENFNLKKSSTSVADILQNISAHSSLIFQQINYNISVREQKPTERTEARVVYITPDHTVTGKVVSSTDGLGIPGVNIIVKGTSTGTVSDVDGVYTLTIQKDDQVLVFSSIGFVSQEVPVAGKRVVDVVLMEDMQNLDEVVVVGYGTVKKSDITGAVSQVKSKEINSFPTSSVMQSLSGRAPGVQVLQTTGAPGAGLSVRIRGTNSIQGGNDPLYVVDGFPFSGSPTNLNNADIESIEVLKDASATAIYGSRGANGVVLITTKQGKAGQTQVDFEASYSVQELRKKLDLMNGQEYATFMNIQAANDNLNPYFTQEEISRFGQGYDWQDLVFQSAPMKTTSLSISGGNDKTQFSIAGGIFGQEGIIKGSDYNRYSLRANINHKISDKFRVTLSNTMTDLRTERRDSGGGSRGNSMIAAAISAAPISSPYNEDGSYRVLANEYPFIPTDLINPLNFIYEQSNQIKANVSLLSAAMIYQPAPEWTIKISGGVENRDDRTDAYTTRKFFNSEGRASVSTTQFRSMLSENTISYNKSINEKHSIAAVAGFTYQDFVHTSLGGSGVGFLSDAFESYSLVAAATPGIPSSGYSKSVLLSYLGRVNYSYADKYLLTASFRSDGSSRYSEGNKWGYFPSAALAWRVSDEGFMKDNGTVSDLKIRASWGLTGSQAIDAYATLNQLSPGYTVFGNELYNTFAPGTRLPGDLKWETTEQIDFGADFGLLGNRIYVTADYYIKNTFDLLNTVSLPSSLGFTTTIQNIGEVQNKGFELGIDAKIATRAFKWDVLGTFSVNRNKVVSLHEGEDILGGFIGVLVVQDNATILREGRPIGQFWGYVEDGYDEQGRINFVDLNDDGVINAEDKTYIGDPNPDFIYGLNSTMSYGNFELDVFLQGSYGNDIFNASAIPSTMDYGQGLNMPREVLIDHWSPSNPDAKYPIISRNTSARVSDRWIEDGSFVRLRNIQLAYNLPLKVEWIRNSQIYVSGQNLITLTKYSWWDPEVNSRGAGTQQGIDHYSYPVPRTFTAGIRVGF